MLSSLFLASAQLVHGLLSLYATAVIVRVLLSWVRPSPGRGVVRSLLVALYRITDPPLDAVRRVLPWLVVAGIDLTPILVIAAVHFTDTFVTGTLLHLA